MIQALVASSSGNDSCQHANASFGEVWLKRVENERGDSK